MTRRAIDDPPGGVLLWLVVAVELLTFAMLFGLVANLRATEPALFLDGQRSLDPWLGVALTTILVSSGALAAQGVHHYRAEQIPLARRYFHGAAGLGGVFLAVKVVDYASHFAAGHGLGTSDFWDAYLLGTGFHFAHVLVGVGLLVLVAGRAGKTQFEDAETAIVGSVLFWHLCDVAWFFLFPLFFVGS